MHPIFYIFFNSHFFFTLADEPTKRSIRVETWRKIQDKDIAAYPNTVFNRIPNFIGVEKAAELLGETSEFKAARKLRN